MTFDETETLIKHIAHLARIRISNESLPKYKDISEIFALISKINEIDTTHIEPMMHPLDISQRLREDNVTETNERDYLQKNASDYVEANIYLVPKVLDEE